MDTTRRATSISFGSLPYLPSTRTGSRVVGNTSRHLVKSSVELGGKSANIVFADADLDAAADGALMGVFFNNGECCVSGSRLFVQSSIADGFITKVIARSRKMKVGDPFDDDTDVGALIDHNHLAKVAGFVKRCLHRCVPCRTCFPPCRNDPQETASRYH